VKNQAEITNNEEQLAANPQDEPGGKDLPGVADGSAGMDAAPNGKKAR